MGEDYAKGIVIMYSVIAIGIIALLYYLFK